MWKANQTRFLQGGFQFDNKKKNMVYNAFAISFFFYITANPVFYYRRDIQELERFHKEKLHLRLNIEWE